MKQITRYIADDGTEWETQTEAEKQDIMYHLAQELTDNIDSLYLKDALDVSKYLLKTYNMSIPAK